MDTKEYYLKNKSHIKEMSHKYYLRHRDMIIEKNKVEKEDLKKRVLTYYGNGSCACVSCGERSIGCLSIDHVGNGGEKHRKIIGGGGIYFYRWLENNGLPMGYQTLCMNCQTKKELSRRNSNGRLKQRLLTYYGNGECKCVFCGEDDISCLNIDHIFNQLWKEIVRRITL